jgi:hypothetical protein
MMFLNGTNNESNKTKFLHSLFFGQNLALSHLVQSKLINFVKVDKIIGNNFSNEDYGTNTNNFI